MTAFQHNKVLGILHLAYGGLTVLLLIVLSIFMVGVIGVAANETRGEDFPVGFFAAIMIFVILFHLLLVTPSFLAGYALLKRKSWAKTMGVIAGIVSGLSFPIGSALCVYTLWFLFGENGRFLYHKAAYALPPARPLWARAVGRQPEREYIPPSAPPDWR